MGVNRADDPLVGRSFGEFVLRERIGEGGFGVVYRAIQPGLDREAVVKVLQSKLHATATDRFLREAKLASRLDHPYAAHIYGFGLETDGELWISMELVRGTPLDQILKIQGPLPLERFVPLLDRICEVVHTAHEQGIVHRDLKPANVMVLARAGRLLPKLLDFGIAKAPLGSGDVAVDETMRAISGSVQTISVDDRDPPSRADLTQRGAVIGSPPYMAPEQWLDAGTVDARTDLYALGILAYEALAGTRPFTGTTLTAIAMAHATQTPPRLGPRFPPALDAVIAKALAKSPGDRYADALSFAAAFRQAAGIVADPVKLVALDPDVRDLAVDVAPQPIAEAVAGLEAARNLHQARDAVLQLGRTVVRYLGLLALACRSRVRGDDSASATNAIRMLYRRSLTEREWIDVTRELTRPWIDRRDAYPLPELVGACHDGRVVDTYLDALDALRDTASEAGLHERLDTAVTATSQALRSLGFVNDYMLVVMVASGLAERWIGVRRNQRTTVTVRTKTLPIGTPALLDKDGVPVLTLAPLFQVTAPTPGAALDLFMFEGRDSRGGKLVALPAGFEHHDDGVWDWFRAELVGSFDEAEAGTAEERAPYRGLSAFSSEDGAVFFGRERLVDAVTNRLRIQPLLAVVGRSGAGKSSFVQAGVIPAMSEWRAVTIRPGPSPLGSLVARLHQAGLAGEELREELVHERHTLGDHLRAAAATGGPILLVVDQLEEVFTLCDDAEERRIFAEAIAGAARDAQDPVRVIVTLRDDFLLRAEQVPALRNRIGQSLQLLSVPAADDLLRILIEPARRAGYEFEDAELPAEMVREVADQPGALALISFTASKLWELRDRTFKQLTRTAYRALGGVGGALAQHAERTLDDMPAEERKLTREALRHLVTTQNTRAVRERRELRQLLGETEHADGVIEKLVAARLLVATENESGAETIEIVHEALLVAWPRLVEWRREDSGGARLHEQLRTAAKQWDERGRPKGLLWRGDALGELMRWQNAHAVPMTDIERDFATASERDASRSRRIRRGLIAGAFAVLVAGVITLLSINARTETERQRATSAHDRAEASHQLALVEHGRELFLAGDPIRAMVYVDAAAKAGGDDPVIRYLSARLVGSLGKERFALPNLRATIWRVAYSPGGETIYTAGADGTPRSWSAATGAPAKTFTGAKGHITTMELSHDGRLLITAGEDQVARIWNVASGTLAHALEGHKAWIWSARFSPDGKTALTASADGTARLWDVATGALVATLAGHEGGVNDAVLAPDGSIFTAGDDKTIARWDPRGKRLTTLVRHRAEVMTLSLSPDGATLVSSSNDGTMAVTRTADTSLVRTIDLQGTPTVPSFSPDGELVAVPTGNTIQIWKPSAGPRQLLLEGHLGIVSRVAFSPDGRWLASASNDSTVKLWDVASGDVIASIPTKDAVDALAFAPDGSSITIGAGHGAEVWAARPDVLAYRIATGDAPASIAWAGADRIATCSQKGVAHVWQRDRSIVELHHGDKPCYIAVDSARIITAGEEGVLKAWDATTGQLSATATCGHKVTAMALSPDGNHVLVACESELQLRGVPALGVERTFASTATIRSLAWTRDGHRFASCGREDTARVWDLATGSSAGFPIDEQCGKVAFSPDGRRFAAATHKTVRMWNLDNRTREPSLVGHHGDVNAVAFVDDTTLVTRSRDKTVGVWIGSRLVDSWIHADSAGDVVFTPTELAASGDQIATVSSSDVLVWRLPGAIDRADYARVVRSLPFELRDDVLIPAEMH